MATATKDVQRTSLYLDADLHQALKVAAVEEHTQMTAL